MFDMYKRYKIVILGPYNSGKTTLIHLLDANAKSVEAQEYFKESTTTVAIDFGRFYIDGVLLLLFGTPGQKRFEMVRDVVIEGVDGIVFLIDGTKPIENSDLEVMSIIERSTLPFVVGVNKVDLNPEAREIVKQRHNERIHAISAVTGEGVIQMLRSLKKQIENMD